MLVPTLLALLWAPACSGAGDAPAAQPQAPAAQPQAPAAQPQAPAAQEGPAAAPAEQGTARAWDFEDAEPGSLPPGWKAGTTNPRPGHSAEWKVATREDSPAGPHVLELVRTDNAGSTFNLCWTDELAFQDGALTVHFRAVSGREDQGGGIAWRIHGPDDYLVARFNPLEDNFRVYTVKGGHRSMLESARLRLDPGWHEMRVEQRGSHYRCSIDGRTYLEGDVDFPGPGGVGVWTKADAATAFDGFRVEPR